jgi:hypothetical protein
MFNNHNLPKSLVNEAANVLGNTNADFDLTPELQSVVAEAARDYVQCPTQEDRKAIIEWHIEQVANINDLEPHMIVNFERAVEHAVNEGIGSGVMKFVSGMSQIPAAAKNVVRRGKIEIRGLAKGRTARRAGVVDKETSQTTVTPQDKEAQQQSGLYQGRPAPKLQKNSVDYTELLDVLGSLNESEFAAYIDLLTESEFAALEQILESYSNEE